MEESSLAAALDKMEAALDASAPSLQRSCLLGEEEEKEEDEPFPFDVNALIQRCAYNETIRMPMGVVLRQALNDSQQQWLYEHFWSMAQGADALEDLTRATDPDRYENPRDLALACVAPLPLVYWCHPYSRVSTVKEPPARLLQWAQELIGVLMPQAAKEKIDSVLAQVYFEGGGLQPHHDRDLGWGLGVSLGAMAVFNCYEEQPPKSVLLKSGDIIVAEFGKMLHGVSVLGESTAPLWWSEAPNLDRVRCNVLFRQALTEAQQWELSERRAQELYGIGVEELLQETGFSLGALALMLRHASEAPLGQAVTLQELCSIGK